MAVIFQAHTYDFGIEGYGKEERGRGGGYDREVVFIYFSSNEKKV